jgi:hypothetical protein
MMRIDVIERQSGRRERSELRLDFGGELPARRGPEKEGSSGRCEVPVQVTVGVDEVGDRSRRQQRMAVDEHEMQPDAQRRKAARPRDCICCRGAAHHEACRGEDALCMRELDGRVDFGCDAEIVGRDDEALQCAARRSRRKWKNSIPSRRRRFIICGLFTISPTIDAILLLRK